MRRREFLSILNGVALIALAAQRAECRVSTRDEVIE
jgi:hypothetical protein